MNLDGVALQGSSKKEEARWYVGKRCAYVYKAKNKTSVPGQAEKSQMRSGNRQPVIVTILADFLTSFADILTSVPDHGVPDTLISFPDILHVFLTS